VASALFESCLSNSKSSSDIFTASQNLLLTEFLTGPVNQLQINQMKQQRDC